MKRKKSTVLCDISQNVRRTVLDRDGHRCIFCGSMNNLQIAHYISRGRLGLGIPKNLIVACVKCHSDMDNGKGQKRLREGAKAYLKSQYKDWNEKDLVYKKGSDKNA